MIKKGGDWHEWPVLFSKNFCKCLLSWIIHGFSDRHYIGQEGWCMGLELRPGSQHSQNYFIPFLNTVIHRARRFTQNCLLLRLDSAHDAEDTRKEVAHHKNIDHIIKLNPRTEHTISQWLPEFEATGIEWQGLRPGKEYATLSVIYETEYGKQRLIIRIIKRTTDSVGQMFCNFSKSTGKPSFHKVTGLIYQS